MPDTSAITGTTPTAGGGDLTAQSAASNIAAAPSIDTLTQLIQGINSRAYLSAPGRSQQLGTIQNMLSGNLDPSTIYENQLKNAEQYGAGGFASDSPAWQTAIQRGLGINRQALIGEGQTAMNQLYAGMPTTDASSQMASPALLQQQQATAAAQALQAQQIANQASQFGKTLGQNSSQFGQTLAQNKANLYASTYGTIPGYNQYGQYTGQTGTYPGASGGYVDQGGAASAYMKSLYGSGQGGTTGSTGAGASAKPLPMGFNDQGQAVQGGKYSYGYTDFFGRYHGNEQNPIFG